MFFQPRSRPVTSPVASVVPSAEAAMQLSGSGPSRQTTLERGIGPRFDRAILQGGGHEGIGEPNDLANPARGCRNRCQALARHARPDSRRRAVLERERERSSPKRFSLKGFAVSEFFVQPLVDPPPAGAPTLRDDVLTRANSPRCLFRFVNPSTPFSRWRPIRTASSQPASKIKDSKGLTARN